MNLFNRLLLIVFGAGLIPVVPTAFFLFYYQSVAKTNIQTLHESVAEVSSLMIAHKTDELNRRLYNMWEPGANYINGPALKKALARNPEFLFMAFARRDGREILSDGVPEMRRLVGYMDLSNDGMFKEAVKTGRPQLGGFELILDLPICRLIYPLDNGYYAFAVINLRDLLVKLGMQKMGKSGGVFLADAGGRVFSLQGDPGLADREELQKLFSGIEKSSRDISGPGGYYVGSYAKVPGFDLYAVTLQSRWEAFRGINLITSLIAFFLLGISTVFYFSALILSRRLTGPVEELMQGAGRVSQQNFKVPVRESADITEMAALLRAFNSMMKEIDRYHGLQVEKMLEEKQKLDLLMSLIHDVIILSDLKGDLLYANSAARALLGIGDGELPVGREDLRKQISVLLNFRANESSSIIELTEGAPGKRSYRVSKEMLSSKISQPAVFMVLRDVTLEQEVQRMKEEFFSAAAHDLRAPLLTMQGYVRLLDGACGGNGKVSGYIANIKDSSARLFEMLENILDISRMEAGNLRPHMGEIRTSDFLNSVMENFKAVFAEKKIVFEMVGSKSSSFVGDEKLLRRVLENLISNAYKFTPSGGKVILGSTFEKGRVSFYVEDTGPGIPKDQLEAVFEKYKQLRDVKAGEDGNSGFGLGLAISRKIVEMHKGEIWAEQRPGGGSKFIFKLAV